MSEIIIPGAARSFCRMGARDYQQDARFPDMDFPPQGFRSFIVCDGVGGEADGEVASATVCNAFAEFMAGYANPAYEFTYNAFQEAISFAYRRLLHEIGERSTNMATTLTFLHLNKDSAMVAHIGDSRVYNIRPKVGVLYRTSDHSLVNMMVRAGTITPEQAINHPKGNIITRSMSYVEPGAQPSAADVIRLTDIEAGDYFLLCTDGVLHDIDDEYLVNLFSSDLTEDEIMASLAERCQESSDNNTAIILRIDQAPANPENQQVATDPYSQAEPPQHPGDNPDQPASTDQFAQNDQPAPTDQFPQTDPTIAAMQSYPTPSIDKQPPSIYEIVPSNDLPLHKRIANRLRNLFTR